MTSLSQRIDEVRCFEIADYSTYFQPFVNQTSSGSASRSTTCRCCSPPGILSLAWGSVVRIIAAGLGLTLDEPLEETVEHARGGARLRDRHRAGAGGHALRACGSR